MAHPTDKPARRLLPSFLFGVALATCCELLSSGEAPAVTLNPGDIVATAGGSIIRVDPVTGARTTIGPGGSLIAIEPGGTLLTNGTSGGSAAIFRVDPTTGASSVLSSGGSLSSLDAYSGEIAVDGAGNIYVTSFGLDRIIRIDATTGAQSTVPTTLTNLLSLATEASGELVVLSLGASPLDPMGVSGVYRVNPVTGGHTLLYSDGYLVSPRAGMAVGAIGDIAYSQEAGPGVNLISSSGALLSQFNLGPIMISPLDVVFDANGNILVADPGAQCGPGTGCSTVEGIGGIIRIDPATGTQTWVSHGDDDVGGTAFIPERLAVVQSVPEPASVLLLTAGLAALGARVRRWGVPRAVARTW